MVVVPHSKLRPLSEHIGYSEPLSKQLVFSPIHLRVKVCVRPLLLGFQDWPQLAFVLGSPCQLAHLILTESPSGATLVTDLLSPYYWVLGLLWHTLLKKDKHLLSVVLRLIWQIKLQCFNNVMITLDHYIIVQWVAVTPRMEQYYPYFDTFRIWSAEIQI